MRRFGAIMTGAVCAVFLSCSGGPSPSVTDDTPENRRRAAEEHLYIAPPSELMKDATEQMAASLPESMRAQFRAAMDALNMKELEDAMVSSMVRRFTVAEITALSDFHGSTEGKSVMKKFGLYMADIMPVMQAELARAMGRVWPTPPKGKP